MAACGHHRWTSCYLAIVGLTNVSLVIQMQILCHDVLAVKCAGCRVGLQLKEAKCEIITDDTTVLYRIRAIAPAVKHISCIKAVGGASSVDEKIVFSHLADNLLQLDSHNSKHRLNDINNNASDVAEQFLDHCYWGFDLQINFPHHYHKWNAGTGIWFSHKCFQKLILLFKKSGHYDLSKKLTLRWSIQYNVMWHFAIFLSRKSQNFSRRSVESWIGTIHFSFNGLKQWMSNF